MLNEQIFAQKAAALARDSGQVQWPELPPGQALLIQDWLPSSGARLMFQSCLEELHWDQPQVRLFGKRYPIPRRHAFVGDAGAVYRWSGLEQEPEPWIKSLTAERDRLASAGFEFNSVLVNHYRGGSDSMGWHADNEKELGPFPVVATLSLGQQRRLSFKRRDGEGRLALDLSDGSLLLTSGAVQHHWLHQVAKSARKLDERISLTFRYIQP